jgi:AAA15 family ATPase/GTPase
MAITAETLGKTRTITAGYIKALEKQQELITTLSKDGPKIPGLDIEQIAKNLAELDQNLADTIDYYKTLAEQEAAKEEQEKADSGIEETDEEKKARRKKKRDEALKKADEMIAKYVKTQKDFIQEQISIIEVNYGVIDAEVKELPNTIILATTTSLQPAAVGAAVPNPIFNLGVLYQTLKSIGRSVGTIKTAFLNMLIAADKIKFVLPPTITAILQKVLAIEENLKASAPSESEVNQPPPKTPDGTDVTLKTGQYRKSDVPGYVIVTAEGVQARKGQPGRILEENVTISTDASGNKVTGIKVKIVSRIPDL